MNDDPHLRETSVERSELLHGHFLHVVRDTVRLPNGQLKAIITDAQGRKTTIGIDTAASDSVSRRTGWRARLNQGHLHVTGH